MKASRGGADRPPALDLFAVTAPGLEGIAAEEMQGLGVDGTAEVGGVSWRGTIGDLYRANLHLRSVSRVLVRVATFKARSFIELERHARRIDWRPFVGSATHISLRVASRKSRLYHQRAIEERFARWIADAVGAVVVSSREDSDEDEDIDPTPIPDSQRIMVRLLRDECTVSVDSSGALLHRRGYRLAVGKAPLRETLAAGMILAADWHGQSAFVDPLCGAGTLPIEAALIARGIPPGMASASGQTRDYPFLSWQSFDPVEWDCAIAEAKSNIKERAEFPILGSDRDEGAIAAAVENARRAGVSESVEFDVRALSSVRAPAASGLLIANPPYGVRVGETAPLRNLYATLGKISESEFREWKLALLSADPVLERATGLAFREVLKTRNGGIPVRVLVSSG